MYIFATVLRLKMTNNKVDYIGISLAGLCLIHCMLFPLLLLFSIGWFHNGFIDLAFLILGLVPVYKALNGTNKILIKWILGLSVAVVAFSIVLDLVFHWENHLIYLGAVGLICGHFLNLKQHQIKKTNCH